MRYSVRRLRAGGWGSRPATLAAMKLRQGWGTQVCVSSAALGIWTTRPETPQIVGYLGQVGAQLTRLKVKQEIQND